MILRCARLANNDMYVRVSATPGRRKETIVRVKENEFKIEVKEEAERNLANRRLTVILSELFNVSPRKVKLISGHRSPVKMFDVDV